jgi:hypothetical protein
MYDRGKQSKRKTVGKKKGNKKEKSPHLRYCLVKLGAFKPVYYTIIWNKVKKKTSQDKKE